LSANRFPLQISQREKPAPSESVRSSSVVKTFSPNHLICIEPTFEKHANPRRRAKIAVGDLQPRVHLVESYNHMVKLTDRLRRRPIKSKRRLRTLEIVTSLSR